MKWVTRKRIQVNRAATAWLVQRFIDPEAEFLFVDPDAVAGVQASQGAVGFDAPGARYLHEDAQGRCSFEALVDERCPDDTALRELARIIHGAPAQLLRRLSPAHRGDHLAGRNPCRLGRARPFHPGGLCPALRLCLGGDHSRCRALGSAHRDRGGCPGGWRRLSVVSQER